MNDIMTKTTTTRMTAPQQEGSQIVYLKSYKKHWHILAFSACTTEYVQKQLILLVD